MGKPMEAVPFCPCCGQKVNEFADLAWNKEARSLTGRGMSVILSPMRAKMFDILWRNFPSGRMITNEAFISAVYADDPDGGPDSLKVIQVQVVHLKKQIRPLGLSVKGRIGYALISLQAEEMAA